MRISATGTRKMNDDHRFIVLRAFEELPPAEEYTSGAAPGLDQFFTLHFIRERPEAVHWLILPKLTPKTQSHHLFAEMLEAEFQGSLNVVRTKLEPPARNPMIVAHGDQLIGFPFHEEERDPYSGTWATIRIARRAQKPYSVHVLEPIEKMASR